MENHMRVLVVDDEEQVLFVVGDGLRRLGTPYDIVTVGDALEAAELLRQDPFSLLITDLKMPGMDGVALTEVARALQPRIKVLWMTAYQWRDADAERLGVLRCMNKPLEVEEIREVTRQVLAGVPPQPAAGEGRGQQVLIVEDSAQDAIVLYQALGEMVQGGYHVKITLLLDEALNSLRYEHFDLILVGLHIGASNELDFIRRVAKLSPDTRVVLLDPPDSMEAERKARGMGALRLGELTDRPELIRLLQQAVRGLPRRRRLLILGEDNETRAQQSKALSRAGYEVYVTALAEEAWNFLIHYAFDLFLWDSPCWEELQSGSVYQQLSFLRRQAMPVVALLPGKEAGGWREIGVEILKNPSVAELMTLIPHLTGGNHLTIAQNG